MSIRKASLLLFVLLISWIGTGTTEAAGAVPVKLGVNDVLTEIEVASIKNTHYAPLRDLLKPLKLTMTGQGNGIDVKGDSGRILLLADRTSAVLSDGTTISLETFVQKGKLMVPLQIAGFLGYKVTYDAGFHLLRVYDATAQLNHKEFVSRFAEKLKPKPAPVPPAVKGNTVYLTFDDGPSAHTSQLLDILKKYEVKATFFMIGPHMNHYSGQVVRMADEGHGLGLHGMTHQKEKFYSSPAAALAEMDGDNAILAKITGERTNLIRTPYGSKPYFTKTFRNKVLARGYHLWDWNVDSEDWKYKGNSEAIYSSVMNQVEKNRKLKSDPVILMHDQAATLKVLPRILENLKRKGYQFGVITDDMVPVNFWKDVR